MKLKEMMILILNFITEVIDFLEGEIPIIDNRLWYL